MHRFVTAEICYSSPRKVIQKAKAKVYTLSFQDNEKVLKLIVVMVTQLSVSAGSLELYTLL